MRHVVSLILLSTSTAFLVSCGGGSGISSSGSSNPGYGPFDRNGNYVEEWADRPAKKHRWARNSPTKPVTEEKPAAVAATKPKTKAPERKASPSTEVASLSRTRQQAPTRTAAPTPKPKPVAYSPPPKPKPKPKPAPPKPKPASSIRHVVVKGDTLYNISRRHNTTVAKIQRANGISGTTIRLGQSLSIPR